MFTKDQRSTFPYWAAHWAAFQMTSLVLGHWKFKYLFHDWYKPWLRLFGVPYKTIQKFHRSNSNHHLEYKGWSKKDYVAMMIDWECSRYTKKSAPLNAIQELVRKGIDLKRTLDGRLALRALKELNLFEVSRIDPEKYVYLRKNDKGRYYIEYAFLYKEVPHKYCLSWYTQGHPNPDEYSEDTWERKPTDVIYKLSEFTCSDHCKVGTPKENCMYEGMNWTEEYPINCACWDLKKCDLIPEDYKDE